MVAQIMRDAGIDGNTPAKEAREKIADAISKIQKWDGTLLKFTFDNERNAYIPGHLLKVNNATGEWNYALPGIAQ
jgi:hypothetical protein